MIMRTALTFSIVAAAVALVPSAAFADAAPASSDGGVTISPMAGFAFTAGGTPLVHITIVNQTTGQYMQSTAVKAGGQDFAYAGGELRFPSAHLALQALAGYHWDSKGGNNLDITFSRVPIELVALYQPVSWLRVGGGLRYDTHVHMTGEGDASVAEIQQRYGNAVGEVLKAEWMVLPDTGIELRWTNIKYKLRSVGGVDASALDYSVSGRSFGAGLNLHF